MPRTGLEDLNALVDPLQAWNWDFTVPNIPGGGDGRALKVKCKSTVLPGYQNELITVGLHGVEVNFAGRPIVAKTMAVTFIETRDLSTRDALLNWAKVARDQRRNAGNFKATYATEAILELYDDTGGIIRTVRLYNCWLNQLEDVTMSGDASAIVEMNATLCYDSFDDI